MSVNVVDVLLLLAVAVFSIFGAHRGLAAQALSLVGLAIGAIVGSFVAPLFLPDNSPWIPVAGLAGALIGASLLGAARRRWGRPCGPSSPSGPRSRRSTASAGSSSAGCSRSGSAG